ncbi:MAG: prepilin-type N-terminal cleavage/methylation domain-containing protein [Deltaproteobacteria bacterium]|nr:prepilin-type N-terminal cleavage/methylation domain-containing protein [Deltaproteobacteria bacterium]
MDRSWLRKKNGFTMIELLAGILISAILMAGFYSVFFSQQTAFSAQEQMAEMNQNIRAALDLMTREIRLAGYKNSTSTFNGVATATSNSIRILADLNQDGDTADENEDISYTYNAGSLQICRNGVGLPVADNITNLSLQYTLKDGTVTSAPANLADIRKITISITARTTHPDQRTGAYRSITLSSDITPRNLAS